MKIANICRFSNYLKQETRHVLDRTLGGDVIYVSGRFTSWAQRQQCTLEDWQEWEIHAKQKY